MHEKIDLEINEQIAWLLGSHSHQAYRWWYMLWTSESENYVFISLPFLKWGMGVLTIIPTTEMKVNKIFLTGRIHRLW